MKKLIFIILAIALVIVIFSGSFLSMVEQADYEVINKTGAIEHRLYPQMIVAEVTLNGDRMQSLNKGFRLLFDYIQGKNTQEQEISMTAPVLHQSEENMWSVKFVMPKSFNLNEVPPPNDAQLKITEYKNKEYIVIKFSGKNSDENLNKYMAKLNQHIENESITTVGQPMYAFFNPPWTLPFMRRNEIMLEIHK